MVLLTPLDPIERLNNILSFLKNNYNFYFNLNFTYMLNLKNFETFDFNGINVYGTSYVKKLKDDTSIYVCTARDGDIIHKAQNIDYDKCINSLKELYFMKKYVDEISAIPSFN